MSWKKGGEEKVIWREDMVQNMYTKAVIKRRSKIGRNRWVKRQSEGRNEEKKNELRDFLQMTMWIELNMCAGWWMQLSDSTYAHTHTQSHADRKRKKRMKHKTSNWCIFSSVILAASTSFLLLLNFIWWSLSAFTLCSEMQSLPHFHMVCMKLMCLVWFWHRKCALNK